MKYLILGIIFFCPFFSFALEFTSSVHSIDLGKNVQDHLVKFDNGRVGFLKQREKIILKSLISYQEKELLTQVVLDKKFYIVSVSMEEKLKNKAEFEFESMTSYRPSNLTSLNEASSIFRRMRKDYKPEGQCFNRALVWTYEEFQHSNLKSMKVFLFFTNRYIRNYHFDWWFHVTPMVYVNGMPWTLDRRYASGPLRTKPWSDIFIRSKRTCPSVSKFNDFADNQDAQDCYLMSASMYFVIPRDLEKYDLTGVEKVIFNDVEIDRAYRDSF